MRNNYCNVIISKKPKTRIVLTPQQIQAAVDRKNNLAKRLKNCENSRGIWTRARIPKGHVTTQWGLIPRTKIITDTAGRLVYGFIPKPYTHTHPYPKHTLKIPVLPRERAAINMLRKLGYTYNQLAAITGRSTSFVYYTIRNAIQKGAQHYVDMRKLAGTTRLYLSGFRWRKLQKYWERWVRWIEGEGEEPP